MSQEKMNKWLSKMQEGKEGFQYWQKHDGIWKSTKGGSALTLKTLYLYVCTPEKILLKDCWKLGDKGKKQDIQIVMKDSQKILVSDNSGKVWRFGFGDVQKNERMLLIYRSDSVLEIIWGTSADENLCHAFCLLDEVINISMADSIYGFLNDENMKKNEDQ